jgi:hypothetical protein
MDTTAKQLLNNVTAYAAIGIVAGIIMAAMAAAWS